MQSVRSSYDCGHHVPLNFFVRFIHVSIRKKREKKMSSRSQSRSRSPRRRYYPRKDYKNPAEIAMFEKIIGRLKAYSASEAKEKCIDKTKRGWPWQSIMKCYADQGLPLPNSARYASEILPYEEQYLRLHPDEKGIPNYVAKNLTAGANLGREIKKLKKDQAAEEIAKILGGYPVPWKELAEGKTTGPDRFDYLFNPEQLKYIHEPSTMTLGTLTKERPGEYGITHPSFGEEKFTEITQRKSKSKSKSKRPSPKVKTERKSMLERPKEQPGYEETPFIRITKVPEKVPELKIFKQKIDRYQAFINAQQKAKANQELRKIKQYLKKHSTISEQDVRAASPDIYKLMGWEESGKKKTVTET
jgi:hypothetical protein